jgi:hypothetical protein
MLLTFDLDRKKCVEAVGSARVISAVEGKRGYDEELAVQLVRAGVVYELQGTEELGYAIKSRGKYDMDPLVSGSGSDFVWDETSQLYRASVNYVTPALDALFFVDVDANNDVASLPLAIEIGWRSAPLENWKRNENDVLLTLRNNYLREEDGTPAGEPDPVLWLIRNGMVNPGYFTALTGGGNNTLDGVATVEGAEVVITTGNVLMTAIGGVLRKWQLQASTAAEDAAAGFVRPDDYHASTNARVWVEIG